MVRTLSFVGVRCVAAVACLGLGSLAQAGNNVIRTLSLDESAKVVELFDGMESGQFQVRLSPKSPQESYVFVKNTTDDPLTVALPKAAVGVHILPEFFPGNNQLNQFGNQFGNQNQGQFGNQNQGQFGNQQGRSQNVGGQFQPFGNNQQGFFNNQNNGNGNGNGLQLPGGNGFFSVPPEKTVQLRLRTVCLDHGLPDPMPGLTYELRRVESVVSNPPLQKLLESFTIRVDQDAMQAAAWHLSNNMSWGQIASLADNELVALTGGKMFDTNTLKLAQSLVKDAEQEAKDNPVVQKEPKDQPAAKPVAAPRKLTSKISKSR